MSLDPIALVTAYLRRLIVRRFFGSVTITFQAGKVLTIRTEETKKLEELDEESTR